METRRAARCKSLRISSDSNKVSNSANYTEGSVTETDKSNILKNKRVYRKKTPNNDEKLVPLKKTSLITREKNEYNLPTTNDEVIDMFKQTWVIGNLLGKGGFGYVYSTSIKNSSSLDDLSAKYAIKIEPIGNGPLFTEIAFYQRVCFKEMIETWKKAKKMRFLCIPHLIGHGLKNQTVSNGHNAISSKTQSKKIKEIGYRFLVIPRMYSDVEKIWLNNNKQFHPNTICQIALRIMDGIEYIHYKGYVHADLKPSNFMVDSYDNNMGNIFIIDYGLTCQFMISGQHKPYKEDKKRKHEGTIEFTSLDSHSGAAPSRRSDLYTLGYVLVWLQFGTLPWVSCIKDSEQVQSIKLNYYQNDISFIPDIEVNKHKYGYLDEYFKILKKLTYTDVPQYDSLRKTISEYINQRKIFDEGSAISFLPNNKT